MPYKLITDELPSTGTSEESLLGAGARNLARLGSRAIEQTVGLPGTIESLGRGALNLIDKGMGREPSVSSETFFPTPQNVREAVKSDTDGRLEPQGPWEKFADDIISDTVPFLIGGASAVRSLATAGLGNLAGLATKTITGSELGGDVVKAGTMLALPLLGVPRSRKIASDLYKKADSLVPEGATAPAKKLSEELVKVSKGLSDELHEVAGKKELSSIISQMQDSIINNKIDVARLVKYKKGLNGITSNYNVSGVIDYIKPLKDSIKSSLNSYGSHNPEFIKTFNQADEVYRAVKTGIHIGDILHKSIKQKELTPKTFALLSSAASAGAYGGPKAIAAAFAGANVYNAINNTLRSPTIRNMYLDVLKSAAKENAISLAKNVARLDKAIGKEEPSKSSGGRYKLVRG